MIRLAALGTAALAVTPAAAFADRQEWRLAVAPTASILRLDARGAEGETTVPGGTLRLAFGLWDILEVGGRLGVSGFGTVALPGATLAGHAGTLYLDAYLAEASIDVRAALGVEASPVFARLHPVVGASVGVRGSLYRDQELLDNNRALVASGGDSLDVRPFAAAEVGAEYRFGRALVVALLGRVTYASNARGTGTSVEVAYLWY